MIQVLRARIALAQLYRETTNEKLFDHVLTTLHDSYVKVPSEPKIWALLKLVEIAEEPRLSSRLRDELNTTRRAIAAEQLSVLPMELFPTADSLAVWPEATIRRLDLPTAVYGIHYRIADRTVLCLLRQERLYKMLQAAISDMEDATATSRICDNFGDFALGNDSIEGKSLVTMALGKFLPEWMVEVYLKDTDVFAQVAKRQTAVYTWAGVLAIVFVVAAGLLAGRAISRQIKLNRLKNDFIATVSHELKTPLASMRVLVDTILEGRTTGDQQVREYLELVGKENHRLSRLIDNFLTFSRMERNKQSFEIVPTDPARIPQEAAEVVKTKLAKNHCQLQQQIESSLPSILADHDAIVTVLVNLLDNACKYTHNDDKQVTLKVFVQGACVCFEVRDNGIGMSKRACRKAFNRFYQADQSLARRAEGCGLGLSIVKFIVDAHKASISVKSQPAQGSIFTIKVPTAT